MKKKNFQAFVKDEKGQLDIIGNILSIIFKIWDTIFTIFIKIWDAMPSFFRTILILCVIYFAASFLQSLVFDGFDFNLGSQSINENPMNYGSENSLGQPFDYNAIPLSIHIPSVEQTIQIFSPQFNMHLLCFDFMNQNQLSGSSAFTEGGGTGGGGGGGGAGGAFGFGYAVAATGAQNFDPRLTTNCFNLNFPYPCFGGTGVAEAASCTCYPDGSCFGQIGFFKGIAIVIILIVLMAMGTSKFSGGVEF